MAAPKLQSTGDTHTQDVKPSLVKVEQVRIDEAADYILHNDDKSNPVDQGSSWK
jgi:hypothetical protein